MGSDTYDTILQVANRLFSQQGYTATSIRQIADEAGIGKATIYHHFQDKQAIVLALLMGNVERMNEILTLINAEKDPRRRIQTATEASLRFLYDSMDLIQIARREVSGGRALIQERFGAFIQNYMIPLEAAIQQGCEQGIFRPVDPRAAVRILLTMIQGSFMLAYLGGERPQPPEKAAPILLDIFFQGIDKR
jgi:AcrR family transcriptional regulator